MAMRTYGVQSICMVLTSDDMQKLLYENLDNLKNNSLWNWDIKTIDDIDCEVIDDFSNTIDYACCIFGANGYLNNIADEETKTIYYDEETIILIELKKDSLFECYNNYDEIYQELQQTFKNVGIDITIDYVKEHFGNLNASYYA